MGLKSLGFIALASGIWAWGLEPELKTEGPRGNGRVRLGSLAYGSGLISHFRIWRGAETRSPKPRNKGARLNPKPYPLYACLGLHKTFVRIRERKPDKEKARLKEIPLYACLGLAEDAASPGLCVGIAKFDHVAAAFRVL